MMRKVISWLLVVLWMALIFYLSHQPASESNSLSTGITERVVAIIERVTSDIDFDISNFNHIVRKNAHFFAYLILGVLVSNALKSNGLKGSRRFLIALAFCILYAISDEIHQLFIPGRAGQVRDVIDVSNFNHIVRKNAHFFAYLILGVLVSNALKSNGLKGSRRFLIALAFCILYAISDEIHQLFIPGRAGQVRDVIIDSAGAVVGISGYLVFGKLKTRLVR